MTKNFTIFDSDVQTAVPDKSYAFFKLIQNSLLNFDDELMNI